MIGTLTGVWPPDERPSSNGSSSVPVAEVSSRRQSEDRMGIFLFGAFVLIVGYLILAHIFGWPVGNSRSDNDEHDHSWSSSHRSSSSSSHSSDRDSFGGGKSSGGGASGSW